MGVDGWAVTFGTARRAGGQRGGRVQPGRAAAPTNPLLAVTNATAHPSTASVPITVLLYDGPLLCGFNVAIKGLRWLLAENKVVMDKRQ